MSKRSEAIRAARQDKVKRRRQSSLPEARNEKRPGVSTRPLECARQRDVVCQPFPSALQGFGDI